MLAERFCCAPGFNRQLVLFNTFGVTLIVSRMQLEAFYWLILLTLCFLYSFCWCVAYFSEFLCYLSVCLFPQGTSHDICLANHWS